MSCKLYLQGNGCECVCPPHRSAQPRGLVLHRRPDSLPASRVSAARQKTCSKTLPRLPAHCLACLYNAKEVLSLYICPSSGVHLPSCSARTSPVPRELRCALVLWNALFIDIFREKNACFVSTASFFPHAEGEGEND